MSKKCLFRESVNRIADETSQNVFREIPKQVFLPRKKYFNFFSEKQLIETIEKDFPVFDNITAQRRFPNKIIINAKERQKIVLYAESPVTNANVFISMDKERSFPNRRADSQRGGASLKDNRVREPSCLIKNIRKIISFIQKIKKDF